MLYGKEKLVGFLEKSFMQIWLSYWSNGIKWGWMLTSATRRRTTCYRQGNSLILGTLLRAAARILPNFLVVSGTSSNLSRLSVVDMFASQFVNRFMHLCTLLQRRSFRFLSCTLLWLQYTFEVTAMFWSRGVNLITYLLLMITTVPLRKERSWFCQ